MLFEAKLSAAKLAGAATRAAGRGGGTSLPGRMLLRTEGGKKRADAIRAGDQLWSRSEFDPDGPLALKVVEEVFVRVASVWHLRVEGQVLETTAEHPFDARGRGWTATAQLQAGDWLRTEEGGWLRVEAVTATGEVATVYNFRVADYLRIAWVPQAGELAVFCGAMVGASLGFLWFNAHPAEIFMGDVGSLALGGAIGCLAVMIKQELLLVLVGGLFVLEALSVIIQVASFKLTGRRVFKMSPLHHHFELSGWRETKVVVRFWIIAIIFALLSLATLKLR